MAPPLCLAAFVFVCAVPPSTSPAVAAAACSLVAHAERLLCMQWPVWGSDASACAMAWHGAAWLARSGLQDLSAARQRPLHGASPQLCTPWLRTLSGCCARSGQTVALMCGLVQWCDLIQCCWPQKTRALFTAVRFTPPSFSRTINTPIVISAMITFAAYIPPLCNAIIDSQAVYLWLTNVSLNVISFIWEGLGVGGCEAGTRGRLLRAKHAMPGPAIVQADAWGPPIAHHMYSGRRARAHREQRGAARCRAGQWGGGGSDRTGHTRGAAASPARPGA